MSLTNLGVGVGSEPAEGRDGEDLPEDHQCSTDSTGTEVTNASVPPSTLHDWPNCFDRLSKEIMSPLALPFFYGFRRITKEQCNKADSKSEACVYYQTEFDLTTLKDYKQVHQYIRDNNIDLPISVFSFEPNIRPSYVLEREMWKEMLVTPDISQGQEKIPIPVICGNKSATISVNYIRESLVAKDVNVSLTHDDEFLSCCDCKDDCQDKLNCSCYLRTLENCSQRTRDKYGDIYIGYQYKRLFQPCHSGLYECNKMCKCKYTCLNRVVQNGIICRLQVFMTNLKGWGVRTLCDIPKGMYISNYCGQVVGNEYANKVSDLTKDGWKYLASLNVGEQKEGYEAEAVEPEATGDGDLSTSCNSPRTSKSSSPVPSLSASTTLECASSAASTSEQGSSTSEASTPLLMATSNVSDPVIRPSYQLQKPRKQELIKPFSPSGSSTPHFRISANEYQMMNMHAKQSKRPKVSLSKGNTQSKWTRFVPYDTVVKLPMSEAVSILYNQTNISSTSIWRRRPRKLVNLQRMKRTFPKCLATPFKRAKRKGKRRGLYPKRGPPPESREHALLNFDLSVDGITDGNIGRYYNHSCNPNIFPQNVFINCHDLRLPTISFFAQRNIQAGEELTWDYKYDDDLYQNDVNDGKKRKRSCSPPRMICHCGEDNCTRKFV